jgi:hypothetical protein
MNPRLVLLALVAFTAYVLGSRAGRGRYEELRHLALGVWNDPATKKTRKKLKQLTAIASRARDKVQRRLR